MSSSVIGRLLAIGVLVVAFLAGLAGFSSALAPAASEALPVAAKLQPSSPSVCTAERQISWPAKNPVWQLCWVPPTASSGDRPVPAAARFPSSVC